MEVSGQLHTLAALPQGVSFQYPLDKKLSGSPEPVWMWWQRKKKFPSLTMLGIEPW
jgi:hypothetical protein